MGTSVWWSLIVGNGGTTLSQGVGKEPGSGWEDAELPHLFCCCPLLYTSMTPFVLPCAPCSYCNDCRDLDLCRDEELLAASLEVQEQQAAGSRRSSGTWSCRQCRQAYNMAALEQRLVEALNQHVQAYELQVRRARAHLPGPSLRCLFLFRPQPSRSCKGEVFLLPSPLLPE